MRWLGAVCIAWVLLAPPAYADEPVGRVAGCVTAEGGGPLADVDVSAVSTVASTTTGLDGCYVLDRVAVGDRVLRFLAPAGSDYVSVFSGNALSERDARPVTVRVGETTAAGADGRLPLGGSITGIVTDPDGRAVPSIGVSASTPASAPAGAPGGSGMTDLLGRFRIGGVPAGTYVVSASTPSDDLLTAWHPAALHEPEAARLDVRAGETVQSDVRLGRAASVGGRVVDEAGAPVRGVRVFVNGYDGYAGVGGGAASGVDGRYRIGGLPPSVVYLQFLDQSGRYQTVFSGDAGDPVSAPRLSLAQGQALDGVDAVMREGGSLGGIVHDSAGRAVPGATVWGIGDRPGAGQFFVTSDAAGRWRASGLRGGSFEVSAGAPGAGFQGTWYPGVGDRRQAGRVALVAPAVRDDVDLLLLRVGEQPTLRGTRSLKVVGRTLALPLRCPSACSVTVARAGRRSRLGSATATAGARRVAVRVTRSTRSLLRRGKVRARVRVDPSIGAVRTFRVTLRRGR